MRIAAKMALIVAASSAVWASPATAAGTKGDLTITVTGLPAGVSPTVTVKGVVIPVSRTFHGTGTFVMRDIPIGRYHVTGVPVRMRESTSAGQVRGLRATAQVECSPTSSCHRPSVVQVVSHGNPQRGVTVAYTNAMVTGPSRFQAFSNTNEGICGLRGDGQISCWADKYELYPAPAGSFKSILPSDYGAPCGLRANGTISCAGMPDSPEGKRFIAQLAGIGNPMCAVQANGAIGCWGYASNHTSVPRGRFVGVAVLNDAYNRASTCGLTADGAVRCAGRSGHDAPAGTLKTLFSQGYSGLSPAGGVVRLQGYDDPDPWDQGPFVKVAGNGGCGILTDGQISCSTIDHGPPVMFPGDFTDVMMFDNGAVVCGVRRMDRRVECHGVEPDNRFRKVHDPTLISRLERMPH